MNEPKQLTTESGAPVADNQNSLTAGPRGPLLVQDWQLFEKHANFNRERIPERVVHAKGSGAYGPLKITGDISRYTDIDVRLVCEDISDRTKRAVALASGKPALINCVVDPTAAPRAV